MTRADHVSDYTLDRLLGDELDGATITQLQAHFSQCEACRGRHTLLASERAAFLQQTPTWEAHVAQARPEVRRLPARRARWWVATCTLSALAACLWLAWIRVPSERETGIRSKGGPQLGFYVKSGSAVRRGRDQELVRSGDLVRFTYSSPSVAELGLFARDRRGVTPLYPSGGVSAPVNAGVEVPLDFGLELDAEPGVIVIHAVFCRGRFALEPLREQLARAGDRPLQRDGCSERLQHLRKVP